MRDWKYTHYKQTGKHHSICQDSVKVRMDSERVIACLCDGLGSLNNSHIAAEVTVNTVIEWFSAAKIGNPKNISKKDLKSLKEDLMNRIRERLRATAEEDNIAIATMDCTLLFVCVFKQHNVALIGNLGDSALCVIRTDGSQLLNDTAFDADGTRAVQDEDAAQHLNLSLLDLGEDVLGFILTSDGLENEIYFKGMDFVAKGAELYFNALLESIPQKRIQERVTALTDDADSVFYDDISIAVISRADAPVNLEEEPTWLCVCGNNNPLYETFCTACGRDFIDLYKNINFKGNKTRYFRLLQQHPEQTEKLMAQLRKADAETQANPFTMKGASQQKPAPAVPQQPPQVPLQPMPPQPMQPMQPMQPQPVPPARNGATIYPFAPSAEEQPQQPAYYEHPAEVTELYGSAQQAAAEDTAEEAALEEGYAATQQHGREEPAPQRTKGNNVMFTALFMAIAFIVGAVLGAVMMAAIKNNRIDELETQLKEAAAQTNTVDPSAFVSRDTKPDKQQSGAEQSHTVAETTEATETTAPEEDPIVGVWRANHWEDSNGNTFSTDAYYVDSNTLQFNADGTVVRDSKSGENKGTYIREQGDEEDEYILTFGTDEVRMVFDRSLYLKFEVPEYSDESNKVKIVYVKSGSSANGAASPENNSLSDNGNGADQHVPQID